MTEDLRNMAYKASLALLSEFCTLATKQFGSSHPPIFTSTSNYLVRTGPTGHEGRSVSTTAIDYIGLTELFRKSARELPSWHQAATALNRLLETLPPRPAPMWSQSVEEEYLTPLLVGYVRDCESFKYDSVSAKRLARALIEYVDAETVEVVGMFALEDFSAARSFRLGPELVIRPISKSELFEFGREPLWASNWAFFGRPVVPRDDWWICEARRPSPRGSPQGYNKMHDTSEQLGLALRAFKAGVMKLGTFSTAVEGPFGRQGNLSGGSLQPLAHGAPSYVLTSDDIPRFVRFWGQFQDLMSTAHHYLHLPLRRLRWGGARTQPEDTIVDHVIGLECLLGTESERIEIGYRLRMRGSVILANKRSERRAHARILRDLYSLRSRIVHGQVIAPDELPTMIPLAEEALRKIWRWFFDRWRGHSGNQKAVEWLDDELIGQ